jgi:plastocyanin
VKLRHPGILPGLLLASCLVAVAGHAAGIKTTLTGADDLPLADAVIYAVPLNATVPFPLPRKAEIDQRNKMFVPAVTVVQTGAAVAFPNSDNIRHQVYSFSPAKVFNIKLYSGRPSEPVVFDKPGVVVLGCNIHDRMLAWVVVVDTPWFSRTDATGVAELGNLPAGDYELHFWHPGLQVEGPSRTLRLGAGDLSELKVKLDAAGTLEAGHAAHGGGTTP